MYVRLITGARAAGLPRFGGGGRRTIRRPATAQRPINGACRHAHASPLQRALFASRWDFIPRRCGSGAVAGYRGRMRSSTTPARFSGRCLPAGGISSPGDAAAAQPPVIMAGCAAAGRQPASAGAVCQPVGFHPPAMRQRRSRLLSWPDAQQHHACGQGEQRQCLHQQGCGACCIHLTAEPQRTTQAEQAAHQRGS